MKARATSHAVGAFACVEPKQLQITSGRHRQRMSIAALSRAAHSFLLGLHTLRNLAQNEGKSGRTNQPRY